MSKNYNLTAAKRDQAGKGAARSLRRSNKTPAVIYGDFKEPVKIVLDENIINVEYRKGHMFTSVCDIVVDGEKHMVLARDIQLHPVTDNVMHVDFLRVTAKTKIAVNVPLHFINEDLSPGLKNKGTLNVVRFEMEVLCSAIDIPEFINVDLDGKDFGDAIRLSDAKLPEGVSPVITNRNFMIANLYEPKTVEEEAADAAADAAAEGAGAAPGPGDVPASTTKDKPEAAKD